MKELQLGKTYKYIGKYNYEELRELSDSDRVIVPGLTNDCITIEMCDIAKLNKLHLSYVPTQDMESDPKRIPLGFKEIADGMVYNYSLDFIKSLKEISEYEKNILEV
jgi:hypothetical protein